MVVPVGNSENNELDSLRMLITLEAIWYMRNKLLHNGGHIDIMKTTQNIEKRIMEYAKTLSKDKSLNGWEAP